MILPERPRAIPAERDHGVVHRNEPSPALGQDGEPRSVPAPVGMALLGPRYWRQLVFTLRRPFQRRAQSGGDRLRLARATAVEVHEQGMTPTAYTRPSVRWREPYRWDAGTEL